MQNPGYKVIIIFLKKKKSYIYITVTKVTVTFSVSSFTLIQLFLGLNFRLIFCNFSILAEHSASLVYGISAWHVQFIIFKYNYYLLLFSHKATIGWYLTHRDNSQGFC